MELKNHWFSVTKSALEQLLHSVNLRPEEVERTWLMFIFYTTVSVGLRWAEDCSVAMFLEYGTSNIAWIYIGSAAVGAGLVVVYSWLQRVFPLRSVIVGIMPCMIVPILFLILLHREVTVPYLALIIIFLLRLWVDACYVINHVNTSIVANQLFNIREIKRTYPLISSGLLVADVISGFSLPWLLHLAQLNKVLLIACLVVVLGSTILLYLTYNYRTAFPYTPQRDIPEEQAVRRRRLETPIKRYALYLSSFVALLQVIGLLIDFQYLSELRANLSNRELASFLGIFGGIVGLFELLTQWFISSRLIEKIGVFFTAALLPIIVGFVLPLIIALLGLFFPNLQIQGFFWGLIGLKFFDELLRYTFVLSSGPALYQPIPEHIRSRLQILSGGTAEAIASGVTGLVIFITLFVSQHYVPLGLQKWIYIGETVVVAIACLKVVWELRVHYVDLLVLTGNRGELNTTSVGGGLSMLKQGIVKALLVDTTSNMDKSSCLELLSQIDPQGSAKVLAPLLTKLSPDLQRKSLEVMFLGDVNHHYVPEVSLLLEQQREVDPEVFALALRYVWSAQTNLDLSLLEKYLQPKQNALVRATAATLILRQGSLMQRVAATKTLRLMLTHKKERERINAVRALREAVYLQELRIHIPDLLQDKSLRVRCTVLEMIAATHLEEHYPSLIAALYYKSTRATAMRAIVRLGNEGLHLLLQIATNIYKPEIVRMNAWRAIAQIETTEAIESLWTYLETSWGSNRDYILRSLIKIHQQSKNTNFTDSFYEGRVETLIEQELRFLGEIYAAYIDTQKLQTKQEYPTNGRISHISELLQRSILDLEKDIKERLMLLLKLLYPAEKMQAAAFNIRSESVVNLARGLEILDHTITLSRKSLLLNILDRRPPQEKLRYLIEAEVVNHENMPIGDRLRRLITLSNLLSDWCLACCFHFAQVAHIRLNPAEIIVTLRHPTGFVREAAISYLSVVSQRVLWEILPDLQKDPHPLIAAQVKEWIEGGRV